MTKLSLAIISSFFLMVQITYAEIKETVSDALPAAEKSAQSNALSTMNEPAADDVTPISPETQSAKIDPSMEQTGFSQGSVVRSSFTSAIDEREPVDSFDKMLNSGQVYFFTELRDMSGQTAIHRWEYNGEVKAEIEFNVGGPRWRVWSSKKFNLDGIGEWKVSVLNGANEVIKENSLILTAAELTSEAAITKPQSNNTGKTMNDEGTPAGSVP